MMKLNPSFIPHPISPSHSFSPRHLQQLDVSQNVFLSIRQPSLPALSSSAPSTATPRLSSLSSSEPPSAKLDASSPSFLSSPTRTSTPLSSSSSPLSPHSPPSTASSSHKRHHSLLSQPSSPTPSPHPAKQSKGPPMKRVKGGPRGTKGLRYFSILVCKKLSECKSSSYNHIADVLIQESRSEGKPADATKRPKHDADDDIKKASTAAKSDGGASHADDGEDGGDDEEHFDEKNIRRRIYDALNVLMAIDMIVKDKKTIRWNGPPSLALAAVSPSSSTASASPLAPSPVPSPHERLLVLKAERTVLQGRLEEKKALLTEQVLEYVGMRYLLERNADADGGRGGEEDVRLYFPFILVNTDRTTTIDCEMSEKHDAVSMRYSDVFSVHDQTVVVRMVGKGREQLWENIPKELQSLVVGLDAAKARSDERQRQRKSAQHGTDDDIDESDGHDDDQPGGREPGEEDEDDEDEEDESEVDKVVHALVEDDLFHRSLPHPSSLYHLTSSSSSSYSHQRSPLSYALQSPAHPSLLSSSAAFLSTPFTAYPSPLIKHLSPLTPSTSPFHSSAFPSMFSPLHASSSASPLATPGGASSPFLGVIGRSGSGARPSSSSRLFGGSDGGVRRSNSVVIGNSSIISSDASGLTSAQITVS